MAKAQSAENSNVVDFFPTEGPRVLERQAASLFLSSLMSVEPFRKAMFEGLGVTVGEGSKLSCLSDFAFLTEYDDDAVATDAQLRPNGLLYLQTAKSMWSSLMVTRVAGLELEASALTHSLTIARQNHVNAIITVCDKFTALPSLLPVDIEKTVIEGMEVYHLPWGRIYTTAKQLMISDENMSAEDHATLGKFIDYMADETKCLDASSRLLPETKAIAKTIISGAALDPMDGDIMNVVASWRENLKFLAFKLHDKFNCVVNVDGADLSTAKLKDQLVQDTHLFSVSHNLFGALTLREGMEPILLKADLTRRTANYSITVNVPEDSNKPTAKLTSLLKKLKDSATDDLYIKAIFSGKEAPKQVSLEMALKNSTLLKANYPDSVPEAYEVLMVRDIASDLGDMNLLVAQVDNGLLSFYEHVAQHLSSPMPPQDKSAIPESQLDNDNVRPLELDVDPVEEAPAEVEATVNSEVAVEEEVVTENSTAKEEVAAETGRLVEILGKLESFSGRG